MTVKHATSSVFVFCELPGGWRVGLIRHPLRDRLMIPGGHVEQEENAAEAAIREVAEETGLAARLIGPPAAPLPPGCDHMAVPAPWWIAEYRVPYDNHLADVHVHVDHLYLALSATPRPGTEPAHPFGWYGPDDLPGLDLFDDTRVLAGALLAALAEVAPDGGGRGLAAALAGRLAVGPAPAG